jgi:hypothetical protein
MSDDLRRRLRSPEVFLMTSAMVSPVAYEAADRIEKLEAGEEEWNRICNRYAARIDKLEAALQKVLARCSWYEIALYNDVEEIIRKTLEGKDER